MDTDRDLFESDDDKLFGKNCLGWVVLSTGSQHFIGRLSPIKDGYESNEVFAKLRSFEPVTLEPAFEFAALTVPTPQGGIARQPFIATPHFALEAIPVQVKPTSYYLFADMKEEDQKTYKGFVKRAISQAKEQRMARAGLIAPGATDVRRAAQGARGA